MRGTGGSETEIEIEIETEMFKFEKLDVWRKAIDLYEQVSLLSQAIHQRDQFSVGEQIRKAALSVSTNIAEGTGAKGKRSQNISSTSLRDPSMKL